MTQYHPHEELLLSYGAGTLPELTSVLIATHLALCPECRCTVRHAEAIGGDLMEQLAPAPVAASALGHVMARLDTPAPSAEAVAMADTDTTLPHPVRRYVSGPIDRIRWRWRGAGVRYLPLIADAGGRLGLLHIAPGTAVPHHGHGADEFALVLSGGYTDAFGQYARGDMQCVDADVWHAPKADTGEACLCLINTKAPIRTLDLVSRLFVRLFPI